MSAPAPTRHLLGVWNPSYDADAMSAHIEVLLRHAQRHRGRLSGAESADEASEDDVYVWWGKVRSSNRQQSLEHLPDILALDAALDSDDPPEVHLYLTDYRSLYVAHVAQVTADDVGRDDNEVDHVPGYYRQAQLSCDCWFRLFDIRQVIADDTLALIGELKQLRNTRYHGRPVSLYGGMVDLPLLVTRDDDIRWFDRDTRRRYCDDRFWVEADAERGGNASMQRELREHRFGPVAWSALDPAVRSFIATAEQLYRTHAGDAAFDLSPVALNLARALELQVNLVVRRALARAPRELRWLNVGGATKDLVSDGNWSLKTLADAIDGEVQRTIWLRDALRGGRWFAGTLPSVLRSVADVRNPAAHGEPVPRERVTQLRAQLVGVGCKGELVDLAAVG